MELLKALGLNWSTLISQFINFGILYWLLSKFALKPLLANIEARQKTIDEGLKNSQAAQQAVQQAQIEQEEMLAQARTQARDIVSQARAQAQAQGAQIVQQAQQKAAQMLGDATAQINDDREKMLVEVRGQLAEIVSIGVQNVIGEKIAASEITDRYLTTGMKASHG